jgi:hypothetical protein
MGFICYQIDFQIFFLTLQPSCPPGFRPQIDFVIHQPSVPGVQLGHGLALDDFSLSV